MTLVVFGPSVFNHYNLDDSLVTQNHPITAKDSKKTVMDVFKSTYEFQDGFNYGYRPITILSFYIEHRIFEESPRTSHTINLVLYLSLLLVLYHFLKRLFSEIEVHVLWFVVLLFAVLPIHTEVVASIKNRDEILSLFFALSSAVFALKFIKRQQLLFLVPVVIFVLLSVLSKKTAIPFMVLIPIILDLKFKLSKNQYLLLCLSMSLPFVLIAIALNQAIFAAILPLLYVIYYWTGNQLKLVLESKTNFKFALVSVAAFTLLSIGFGFKDIVYLSAGFILLFPLSFKHQHLSIYLYQTICIIAFLMFDTEEFALCCFAVSAFQLLNYSNDWSSRLQSLIPSLLMTIALLYDGKVEYALTILVLVAVLASGKIHNILPLALAILSSIAGLLFFEFRALQMILLVFGIYFVFKNKVQYAKAITVICCLTVALGSANVKIADREVPLLNSVSAAEQNNAIGRKLEFIENSLIEPHTVNERVATAAAIFQKYCQLTVFPLNLSFYYGYSEVETVDFSSLKAWMGLTIFSLLIVVLLLSFGNNKLLSIGILIFLASISIFSNLPFLISGMIGERLAFNATIGFSMMIGGVLLWLKSKVAFINQSIIMGAFSVIIIAYGFISFQRSKEWKNHLTLMSSDIQHLEHSAQANYLLGMYAINAIETNPNKVDSLYKMGIKHLKKAINIYPQYFNFHFDLAKIYQSNGDLSEAELSFLAADRLEPQSLLAKEKLTTLYFESKQFMKALNMAKQYLAINTSNQLITEISALSAYFENKKEEAQHLVEKGLLQFPNSQNLNDLKSRLSYTDE